MKSYLHCQHYFSLPLEAVEPPSWLALMKNMLSYNNIHINKNLFHHCFCTVPLFLVTYWRTLADRSLLWWWGSFLPVWAGPGPLAPPETPPPWSFLHPSPPSSLWTPAWVRKKVRQRFVSCKCKYRLSECVGSSTCQWRRLSVFSCSRPRSVSRAGWGTLS